MNHPKQRYNDHLLRRYLLGQCAVQETEDIDQSILSDDAVGVQLDILEDELTEDYVLGALNDPDRLCFERLFLNNDRRARKIRLSATLFKRSDMLSTLTTQESGRWAHTELFGDLSGAPALGRSHTLNPKTEVVFRNFNRDYLERLRFGDFKTELGFIAYFSELIKIQVRSKTGSTNLLEDIGQEVFSRVFESIRTGRGVPQPEQLGAFVTSICNNVILESYRSSPATSRSKGAHSGGVMPRAENETGVVRISSSITAPVGRLLSELPERDRQIVQAMLAKNHDREQLYRQFGINRNYLNVLLRRAKERFIRLYLKAAAKI
jgi:RNA polymerase sigma-70 factor (ECF subfamily)